jgi:hypothetical protein
VASLEETIANLAHENLLLKRKLFGNKTERGHTSEMQLALGDLLATESGCKKSWTRLSPKQRRTRGTRPSVPAPATRTRSKGRRDLLASKLPRFVMEVRDEELEAQGCRRIGFEDSGQLMFRRGGFMVLVKRLARYDEG